MVQKLQDLNGHIDPTKIHGTLDIGTYSKDVAEKLQGLHGAAQDAASYVPAAPAAPQVAALHSSGLRRHMFLQVGARSSGCTFGRTNGSARSAASWERPYRSGSTQPSGSSDPLHQIGAMIHQGLDWTFANPLHTTAVVLALAVIGLTVLVLVRRAPACTSTAKLLRLMALASSRASAVAFRCISRTSACPPLLMALAFALRSSTGLLGMAKGSVAYGMQDLLRHLDTPAGFLIAMGTAILLMFARHPSVRRSFLARWAVPTVMAGLALWKCFATLTGWMAALWAGVAFFGSFFIAARATSDSPLNLPYRLARTRWLSLLLIPIVALGIGFGIWRSNAVAQATQTISERNALIKNSDALATNYAVGPQAVVLPVQAPAGIIPGTVSRVNDKKNNRTQRGCVDCARPDGGFDC